MKLLQTLKLILVPLLCASGFALAATQSRTVWAPSGASQPELSTRVPADRYLDLGAVQPMADVPAYQRAKHVWEREAGRSMSCAEFSYVDVARHQP